MVEYDHLGLINVDEINRRNVSETFLFIPDMANEILTMINDINIGKLILNVHLLPAVL